MTIIIDLTPEQEARLSDKAAQSGKGLNEYARDAVLGGISRQEWERRLRKLAVETGVSLSDEAVSSEGLYEDHL